MIMSTINFTYLDIVIGKPLYWLTIQAQTTISKSCFFFYLTNVGVKSALSTKAETKNP